MHPIRGNHMVTEVTLDSDVPERVRRGARTMAHE